MKNIWAIVLRELRAYFLSPIAYILFAVFLIASGYFYQKFVAWYAFLSLQYMRYQAFISEMNIHDFILRRMAGQMGVLLLLITPIMTMRLLSEEKKLGTYELLLTSPIKSYEIVVGKFFSATILLLVLLVLSFEFPIILFWLGNPQASPIISTYLGLFLTSSCMVSVGLLCSSITENQIVSAVLTFLVLLILWVIGWAGPTTGPALREVLSYISFAEQHFDNLTKGILDTRDIVYYLSFIFFMLFVTVKIVESHRWRE